MGESGPFWLAPLDVARGGVDHLGLRQPGLEMANRLLPGFTNTTTRVRYYTVIAWMFAQADGDARRLRLLESAFVHGTRMHHPHGPLGTAGIVGSERVPWPKSRTGTLPLVDARSRDMVSALDAPFYGPSARTLGVAGRIRGKLKFSNLAQRLAATVPVEEADLPRVGDRTLDRTVGTQLGSMCFCQPAAGVERDLLEEVLFRHTERRLGVLGQEETTDGPRRRSLALILATLAQGPADHDALLQRLLDAALDRGEWHAPDRLADEAIGFAWVALRYVFRYALETVWVGLGQLMKQRDGISRHFGALVDELLASSGHTPDTPVAGTTVDDTVGTERRMLDDMRTAYVDRDTGAMIVDASAVLAHVAACVPRLRRAGGPFATFADLGRPNWVSLSSLAERLQPDMPFGSWVCLVIERFVVAQHLLTASRKWSAGRDGYFFRPAERGYVISGNAVPFHDWIARAGNTKVPAALELMRGIGLVEPEADADGQLTARVGITDRGRATLKRVLGRPSA